MTPEVVAFHHITESLPGVLCFTDRFPPDFTLGAEPVVLIRPPVTDENAANFASPPWRRASLRVFLYARTTSSVEIREAALAVRNLFDRTAFVVEGVRCSAFASGPTEAPVDDGGQVARLIQVTLTVAEGN